MTTMMKVCVDCQAEFELPLGERIFYDAHGLVYPKRCKPCRAKKRERNTPPHFDEFRGNR
jgi:hypothetical protein